jgi:hypothetical protein
MPIPAAIGRLQSPTLPMVKRLSLARARRPTASLTTSSESREAKPTLPASTARLTRIFFADFVHTWRRTPHWRQPRGALGVAAHAPQWADARAKLALRQIAAVTVASSASQPRCEREALR